MVQCIDVIMLIELGESEIPYHLHDRAGEIKIYRHLQGPPLPVKLLQVQVYSNKDAQCCNAGPAFFFLFFFFRQSVLPLGVPLIDLLSNLKVYQPGRELREQEGKELCHLLSRHMQWHRPCGTRDLLRDLVGE